MYFLKKGLQLYDVCRIFIYLYSLNITNILQIVCTGLLYSGTDERV